MTRRVRSRFWNTPPDSATTVRPVLLAYLGADGHDRGSDAVVEPRSDDRHRQACEEVLSRCPDQVSARHAQLARVVRDGRRVSPSLAGVSDLLQLDGGLPFVVDRVADAEQGGDRVEQAPGARGQRRIDAASGHARDSGPALLVPVPDGEPRRQARWVAGRQVRGRHPPRLADRGSAARHRHGHQAAGSLEAGQIRDQELAAPDRAVGPVPGPVEGDADDRAVLAVVGEAGGDVRVMVLHADELNAGQFTISQVDRVRRGQVVRMQVVRDELRLDVEEALEMLDAIGERPQRLRVLQVADVVGHERMVTLSQAERVLQLGTAGQHRPRERLPHSERLRHIPPRAPEHRLATGGRADDRVVGANVDGPVMHQEGVGDPSQPVEGIGVAVGDRLIGHVPARHHQWPGGGGKQQMVQRRVREQQPEVPVARRDRRGDELIGGGQSRQQNDRPAGAGQRLRCEPVNVAQHPRRGKVGDHHGKRLVLAMLARAQGGGGGLVPGINDQVVAPEALEREHLP